MAKVTPFLRPIATQGGSFFCSPSASEDLTFSFNSDGKRFKFSKYCLLNIPDVTRPTLGVTEYENCVQFDAIPGAFPYVLDSKSQNLMLAESLENYSMNFETMLTNTSTYNPDAPQNISERVFFKWMKEMGAIRFREATSSESSSSAGLRFTEEDTSTSYSKVVQYVGEIDVVNSVKNSADAFSEIYVHVPTKDGATPLILFQSLEDTNYPSGKNIINAPSNSLNSGYIFGREYTQTNPAGLDIHSFFDSKFGNFGASAGLTAGALPTITTEGNYQLLKYDSSTSNFLVDWWFPYGESNSYWTEPAADSGTFDSATNDSLMIRGLKIGGSTAQNVYLQRSRLDGIMVDFKTEDYLPIASNPSLKGFSDFNALAESVSFEFNAVLIYYDLEDITDATKTVTNLFGVLFLDNVEDTVDGGGEIPRLKKYKPNRISGLNGNSYGFKVNLKFDVNTEDSAIVSAVNEYSPFSMQLFTEAINKMQSAADSITDNSALVEELKLQISDLAQSIYDSGDLSALSDRVTELETQLENAGAMLDNSESLSDLITRNYDEILNIYKNKTSVTVSYNVDVIQSGDGIIVDKSVPNQLTISNIEQNYTINSSPLFKIYDDFINTVSAYTKIINLEKFSNYLKISNQADITLSKDIIIYVDDTTINWSNGQTYKIVVDHLYPMDLYTNGTFDLIVYTDATDKMKTGNPYSVEIARISSSDFYDKAGSPSIEIICLEKTTYNFTYDLK